MSGVSNSVSSSDSMNPTSGLVHAMFVGLGAFAASAFEKGAYMDGWQEALRRCWRAGAFATGTLILCTQAKTYAVLSAAGLEPVLGASFEGDVAMINSVNELVVDALTQATALTAFRLYRAADAEGYDQ